MNIADMIAEANGRVVRTSRLPDFVHVYPQAEENDHAFDGGGCWCMPNHVYNGGETVLVHKKTRV